MRNQFAKEGRSSNYVGSPVVSSRINGDCVDCAREQYMCGGSHLVLVRATELGWALVKGALRAQVKVVVSVLRR